MAQFLSVFYSVFQIWVFIAVGYAARRLGSWTDEFFQGLSRLLVRIVLPIYFLVRFARWDIAAWREVVIMPALALAVVAVGIGLGLLMFAFLPFRGADRRAGVAMAAFGNSGFIPLALAEILCASNPEIGSRFDVAEPLLLIGAFVGGYSPLVWGVGGSIITADGTRKHAFSAKKLISPPVIGIGLGVLVSLTGVMDFAADPSLPVKHLLSAADKLAATTMPLALINLGAIVGGLQVNRRSLTKFLGVAAAVGAVRLILLPGLFLVLWYLDLLSWASPAILFVIFLQLNTPPATTLSLIATESGVNKDHTAVTLLVTYTAYMILMPLFLGLFVAIT